MFRDKHDGITISTINNYGKNLVFAKEPYSFYMCRLTQDDSIKLGQLSSFSVYVLPTTNNKPLIVMENGTILRQGDMIQVENLEVTFGIIAPIVELLVAGVTDSYTKDRIIKIIREKDVYKVTKPWGYELWINGEHPGYILKRVRINVDARTSLQYHRYKQETNVIFSGEANIHHKKQIEKHNDHISYDDIELTKVLPMTSINICPNTIHRIEALTDIVLYEISTPYLDDVIRIQDDTARNNGRIPSEHGIAL